jgi:hypothetical protein
VGRLLGLTRRLKTHGTKDAHPRRAKLREWLNEVKRAGVCVRCGFADHRALHYHHRDDATKVFNIGDSVRVGLSLAQIKAEVAKCDLLCANRHRIEHHERRSRNQFTELHRTTRKRGSQNPLQNAMESS